MKGVWPTHDTVEAQQDRKVVLCMLCKSSGKLQTVHFLTSSHIKMKAV